jgi:hypothetical protein
MALAFRQTNSNAFFVNSSGSMGHATQALALVLPSSGKGLNEWEDRLALNPRPEKAPFLD